MLLGPALKFILKLTSSHNLHSYQPGPYHHDILGKLLWYSLTNFSASILSLVLSSHYLSAGMTLLNRKWDHAILSFKIIQQFSMTSEIPDPFAWPMRYNIICTMFGTPTLFSTPPSFTDFLLWSYRLPFRFSNTPMWSCFKHLELAVSSLSHIANSLTSLKSLLQCQLLSEAYPSPSYGKLQTTAPRHIPCSLHPLTLLHCSYHYLM